MLSFQLIPFNFQLIQFILHLSWSERIEGKLFLFSIFLTAFDLQKHKDLFFSEVGGIFFGSLYPNVMFVIHALASRTTIAVAHPLLRIANQLTHIKSVRAVHSSGAADLCTRLNNSVTANYSLVKVFKSKENQGILNVLRSMGLIDLTIRPTISNLGLKPDLTPKELQSFGTVIDGLAKDSHPLNLNSSVEFPEERPLLALVSKKLTFEGKGIPASLCKEILAKQGNCADMFLQNGRYIKNDNFIFVVCRTDKRGLFNFKKLDLVSKPGRRMYVGYKEIQDMENKFYIIRTSKGMLSSDQAIANRLGGEILIKVQQ